MKKELNIFEIQNLLEDILTSDRVVESINKNINFILSIFPKLKNTIDFEHNHPHHHLDVWTHTLLALNLSENDFIVRLSLLLHDIGKPFSYQDMEVRHFKGHANMSSSIARNYLERLMYDKDFIDEVCYLIEKHDTKITEEDIKNNIGLEQKRYEIQHCDALAHHPAKLEKRKQYLDETKEMLDKVKVSKR